MTVCPNCGHLLDGRPLPEPVVAAVRRELGPGRRTFDAVGRRVRHAYRVWDEKYGPLNGDLDSYAAGLLAWCVSKAGDVTGDGHKRARVYLYLDGIVHDERVHAGFLRRSSDRVVDVDSELAELAA